MAPTPCGPPRLPLVRRWRVDPDTTMLTRRTLMTSSGAFLTGGLASRPAQARGTTAGITSAGTPMRIGTVALTVRDLDTVGRFYQQVIGLTPIETGAGLVRLGVGEKVLLELRHN